MWKYFVIALLLVLTRPELTHAQQGKPLADIPGSSAGVTIQSVDFRFNGTVPSEVAFRFDGLAYGVFYSREPIQMVFIRGQQAIGPKDDLVLTDFTLNGWTAFRPFKEKKDGGLIPFIPMGLESNYRRIKRTQGSVEVDAFEYTVIAAGAGLGLEIPLAKGRLVSKGMGYYGIASRSFSYDTDTSAILEGSIVWSSTRFINRFGVEVGYNYRWQKWYSDLGRISGSSYDFVGSHHAIQIGLSF